jgi:hypothetical protein
LHRSPETFRPASGKSRSGLEPSHQFAVEHPGHPSGKSDGDVDAESVARGVEIPAQRLLKKGEAVGVPHPDGGGAA